MKTPKISQTAEFSELLQRIKGKELRKKIKSRLARLMAGYLGDWKPIEGTLIELRIMGKFEYRIYLRKDEEAFLILWGGQKKTQKEDVLQAKKLAIEYASAGVGI